MSTDVRFIDHAPHVRIVGITEPNMDAMLEMVAELGSTWGRDEEARPESVAVFAGASCYVSYDNKAGRSDAEYLRQSIVEHGHFSVIEHINVSFGVTYLPRSVQMEVIRHRPGSAYSFISQRFVHTEGEFVVPPILRGDGMEESRRIFEESCETLYSNYLTLVEEIKDGYTKENEEQRTLRRKRQKEAARALLPNCVTSSGVITYNARQLRHVIEMRTDEHADASIREFAAALYEVSKDLIPYIFQDATVRGVEGVPEVKFAR